MDPKVVDAALARALHAEAMLRALVDDLTAHYKGRFEPMCVGLARAAVAQLPA